MSVTIQVGTQVTRPTFWRISPTGKAVFYYLAAVSTTMFLWGVYQRFARYTRGQSDRIARLDDLASRITTAIGFVESAEGTSIMVKLTA